MIESFDPSGAIASVLRYLIGALAVVSWLAAVVSYMRLLRLEKSAPGLLQEAGIVRIDGWLRCIRGMYRLGYTSLGEELPSSTRLAFKLTVLGYIWLPVLAIAILLGYRL